MPEAAIRDVGPDEVAQLAAMMARAYREDPFSMFLVAGHPDPAESLRRSFAQQIRSVYMPLGVARTTDDLAGIALWSRPGAWKLPVARQVSLLPGFVRNLGIRRVPRAMRAFTEAERHHPDDRPHWHLQILAVDPERQGSGIGSALMRDVLAPADSEHQPAFLETTTERNVRLYERHGFHIHEEWRMTRGPQVWGMWREPQ